MQYRSARETETDSKLKQFEVVNEINRRRTQLADEMGGIRDVAGLSLEALLDTLLILSFDEACTNRASRACFWGAKDPAVRTLEDAVAERLRNDFSNVDPAPSRGRGTMAAHGQVSVEHLWHLAPDFG
ncbi:hypothetical protein E2F50_03570 [Rhizobium deserti]|uniref:Uncharacterized protein n=1 Tax=Rhizobium deserti TaxID=2547961 RepID=A0A4R5UN97_9HYPH|nr:hypothetical protein [Rhizobium deserti]TDK39214.1 hypothetical protein E2F50_03570 [Rhizobium deserti]